MSTPLFSLIVPVYNVAEFIEECLRQCFDQPGIEEGEYEVIVVDDGSKDESISLARPIIEQHSNACIIHQENKGLSEARNAGQRAASGKYVWFIDSDDYITTNCLAQLKERILEADAPDIVSFSSRVFEVETVDIEEIHPPQANSMTGVQLLDTDRYVIPVHHYLYKHEFLLSHQLTFYPRIYHEDEEFGPRALYFATKVIFDQRLFYNYRMRSGSITHTYTMKHPTDLETIVQRLLDFTQEGHRSGGLDRTIARLFLNILTLYRKLNRTQEPIQLLGKCKKNPRLMQILHKHTDKRFRFLGKMIQIFPTPIAWQVYKAYHQLTKH